ncbi:hypothetical protein CGMCC3_g2022 [Colletotrichum fructicola]|nr:uncharacterized protein CGMCC3_g2022 [Colletotrichum fructicola]KAE9581781.1 hypothetical protein CGMCC3_g2022 [Colletotrichum fructicola]
MAGNAIKRSASQHYRRRVYFSHRRSYRFFRTADPYRFLRFYGDSNGDFSPNHDRHDEDRNFNCNFGAGATVEQTTPREWHDAR